MHVTNTHAASVLLALMIELIIEVLLVYLLYVVLSLFPLSVSRIKLSDLSEDQKKQILASQMSARGKVEDAVEVMPLPKKNGIHVQFDTYI